MTPEKSPNRPDQHAPSRPRVVAAAHALARWSGAVVLVIGGLALLGGLFSRSPSSLPGGQAWQGGTPPGTALALCLGGLALLLSRDRPSGSGPGIGGLLAGLAALAIAVLGSSQRVQMGPVAVGLSIVIGIGLLLLAAGDMRGRRYHLLSQLLFLAASMFSIAALGANLFGELALTRASGYPAMTWPTSLGFVLLSLGGLCARPESGIVRTVTADAVGGEVARRLMPAALLSPLVLCILCYLGYRAGWYGSGFGLAVLTALNSAVMTALVWRTAGTLNQTDVSRRAGDVERSRLNEELEGAHAFLGKVLDSAVFAVLALDLKGRITLANQRMAEIAGRPAEELLGQPFVNLVAENERAPFEDEVLPALRAAAEGGQAGVSSRGAEAQVVRLDGSVATIAFGWAALVTDGRAVGFVGTGEDVTERKKADAKLRAHQREIEELNVRLKRAMAETHHRVRNNLQIISALADMQVMAGDTTVPVSEMRRIATQVQALAAVHDILTRETKTDAGSDTLSAAEVLERLTGLLHRTAGGRAIHVRADAAPLSGRQASALAVIANELIVNALKYSGTDVEVRFECAGAEATLTVLDCGPGFPTGFDPERDANTGLGLVQQMAEWDLQGEVQFTNLQEGGASVTVRMPYSIASTPLRTA